MIRRCLKPIDAEATILCARPENHELYDAKGCCPHEETISHGRSTTGRLRRKCQHCGDQILAAELIGQEYLVEEELCSEAALICHSSVGDYEIVENEDKADEVRVREGVPPDAIRAISSLTLEKSYDDKGKVKRRVIKITLWSKTEGIAMAGRRFNAFPTKFELVDAAGMLAKLAGVSKDELPKAEET